MSEGIPPILICEGCTEASTLQQINEANATYVGYGDMAQEQIRRFESQIDEGVDTRQAEHDRDEILRSLGEHATNIADEASTVGRVNAIDFCEPGTFCAREHCYRLVGSASIQDPRYQNPEQ